MNKTVIIEDCYSDQEARETAESMYGMEVLRVMWIGNDSHSYESTSNYSSSSSNSIDGGSILGLLALLAIGAVIMFIVKYWWIVVPVVAVLGLLAWYGSEE